MARDLMQDIIFTCIAKFVSISNVSVEQNTKSPKSEHEAGDLCVIVVEADITHSSPGVVVVDLKTSSIRWSVRIVTGKSHRH